MNPFKLLIPAILIAGIVLPGTSGAQISFKPYQVISTGGTSEVVGIGDINNDGRNDVVVGNSMTGTNSYKLLVYLQSSQGQLGAPVMYAYPNVYPGLRALTIADVNNDQRKDVIIGYGDSIGIYYQNASGTLNPITRFYSGTTVDGVKTGDMNGDGLTDIVVSNWGAGFIRVFYQTATGFTSSTFTAPQGGYDEIDVGDVNGDGKADVVLMTGQAPSGLYVYTQNAAGSLNSYVTYAAPGTGFNQLHGMAIADLNGDGKADIVASEGGNTPSAKIVLWYQDAATHLLQSPVQVSAYNIPQPVEVADLDCDGKPEIITVHGGWNNASVYAQDTAGHYSTYAGFNLPYNSQYKPEALSVGDINGDGRKDIAIADNNNGLVLLLNNTAPAILTSNITTVTVDTTYRLSYSQSYNFTRTRTDTAGMYTILHTDSLRVTSTQKMDSLKTDSVTIRSGVICSGTVTDTVRSTTLSLHIYQIIDTVVYGTHADSARLSVADIRLSSVHMYPNPAGSYIYVEMSASAAPWYGIKMRILNTLGAVMWYENNWQGTGRIRIDSGKFPPGIYLLEMEDGVSSLQKPFIKE